MKILAPFPVLALIGILLFFLRSKDPSPIPEESTQSQEPVAVPPPEPASTTSSQPRQPETLPEPIKDKPTLQVGKQAFANYPSDDPTGQKDIQLVGDFISNVFLIVKSRDSFQYANNQDLVAFLKGRNDYKEPYLPDDSPILKDGLLVDRWGTPLQVHPVSHNRLEIISAGPDQKPYTEDDLQWPRKLTEN